MKIQLDDHLNHLKDYMKDIAQKVINSINNSKIALMNTDIQLAKTVIREDKNIDQIEIDIDEICVQILALQNPIAHDLRFLFSASKINTYLERIGDFSSLIAREVIFLHDTLSVSVDDSSEHFSLIIEKIKHVFDMVQKMVEESFLAFLDQNDELVQRIFQEDLKVDSFYEQIFNFIMTLLQDKKLEIKIGFSIVNIIKSLERMGDYAKNICEEAIYLKDGKIIKHKSR